MSAPLSLRRVCRPPNRRQTKVGERSSGGCKQGKHMAASMAAREKSAAARRRRRAGTRTHTRSKPRRQTPELAAHIRMSAAALPTAHQPLLQRRARSVGTAEERTKSTQAQTWPQHQRDFVPVTRLFLCPSNANFTLPGPSEAPSPGAKQPWTRARQQGAGCHLRASPPPQALPLHLLHRTPSAASHGVGARRPSEVGGEGRAGYVRVPLDTSSMTCMVQDYAL